MPKQKVIPTRTEVFDKIAAEWDFEKILDPYREGGSPEHPVKRTWGLIISWLVDKKRFPIDVVGAAIMLTVDHIKREGDLVGVDKYGGRGEAFDHSLLTTCDMIQKQKLVNLTYKSIAEARSSHMQVFIANQVFNSLPWWVKWFTKSYWQFKRIKKHGTT